VKVVFFDILSLNNFALRRNWRHHYISFHFFATGL